MAALGKARTSSALRSFARHFALSKEFSYFVINKTVKAVIAPNPYHYIYTLNEKIHSDHAPLCTVRLRADTDADVGRML